MRILFTILVAALFQTQAPPATEIFLAPLSTANGTVTVGAFTNITNSAGYDNQPFFTPDGAGILFVSVRNRVVSTPIEGAPRPAQQTDVFRYDIASKAVSQVTDTLESEYSPTVTPDGKGISVIRVEADGTQRLWKFTLNGKSPELVLENVKPVGYHAWIDAHRLALFVLGGEGKPSTLQMGDTRTGRAEVVATDIARSVQRFPAGASAISFVQREGTSATDRKLVIKSYDPDAKPAVAVLTEPVAGSTEPYLAWTGDGALLMAHGGKLHRWTSRTKTWTVVADLDAAGLKGPSRIAVSPKGDYIAVVAEGR